VLVWPARHQEKQQQQPQQMNQSNNHFRSQDLQPPKATKNLSQLLQHQSRKPSSMMA